MASIGIAPPVTKDLIDTPAADNHAPARMLGGLHPLVAGALALAMGYLALVVTTIAVGLLLIHVVLGGWLTRADNGAVRWLARHRTPTWTDVSWVGSHLAETATVLVVVALVAVVLFLRHRALAALFFLVAIAVEGATYLGTVTFVDRPRPHVVRLEHLGSGASYPSGHTAAAVVVYVGIAIIVCRYVQRAWVRRGAIVLAVIAPIAVAVARVYRGMHHPLDVASGALVGFGCLAVGLFVAEAVGAARERRHAIRP